MKVEPGRKIEVDSGYDLVAKHDPVVRIPGSVPAATYGLILVLRPEEEPATELQDPEVLHSITTEPFAVRVPPHPKLKSCEAPEKPR